MIQELVLSLKSKYPPFLRYSAMPEYETLAKRHTYLAIGVFQPRLMYAKTEAGCFSDSYVVLKHVQNIK
jgi:hypothetical protein